MKSILINSSKTATSTELRDTIHKIFMTENVDNIVIAVVPNCLYRADPDYLDNYISTIKHLASNAKSVIVIADGIRKEDLGSLDDVEIKYCDEKSIVEYVKIVVSRYMPDK